MKELGKWQVISFISRLMAMALGFVQTFVIIRVLTVGEWGVIQLAISIGGALGIYQHLGLASASTREISSAKSDKEVFQVFITSAVIRYAVTLPIAFGLFFFSKHLAVDLYKNADLIVPLKLYAVSLVFQGMQSLLNSVISGTKRFKQLFLYQVAIAFVSVLLFIPLVYFYNVNGYFYAFIIFNAISTLTLLVIAFKPLTTSIAMPNKHEFKTMFKEIFSISLAIYLVKIIYTNWEKFGSNALGLFNSTEVVAVFAFALLYAKKLMSISDSVTDVNLPVLSEKFSKDINEFKSLFVKNFDKIFITVSATSAFASFWAPEIIKLIVGSNKYESAYVLIAPVMLSFIFYSFINIVQASVMIPAKMVKHMIFSYILLLVGTVAFFFGGYKFMGVLPAMAWAMAAGSIISFFYMLFSTNKKLKFSFFNIDHAAIVLQTFVVCWASVINPLWVKSLLFVVIYSLLIWAFFISGFIQKSELRSFKNKTIAFISSKRKKNEKTA